MNNTASLQAALRALGFDPGPVDGIPGRQTIRAIRAFQSSHGLPVDGIAGPATLAELARLGAEVRAPDADGRRQPLTPWIDEAERYLGLREVSGSASNPTILDWARALGDSLGAPYTGDDIPWCGLFVSHCIATTLPDEPLPAVCIRAKSWLQFGVVTSPTIPRGAIGVFDRPGGGHVGFLVGADGDALYVLGGNQADKVSMMRLARERLLAARWPATVPLSTAPLPNLRGGPLSTNEA